MSSADSSDMWTAHPFLREWFRKRLGCPPERVFGVVSARLSIGLESRPSTTSSEPDTLDRYEQLIEALVLAGREQEAFELYWYGLGRFEHLGKTLGDYNRGYRTVVSFSATGRPEDLAPKIMLAERAGLANALGMFAEALGQLDEAWTAMQVNVQWTRLLGLQRALSLGLQNSGHVAFLRGRLRQAQLLAENAQAAADAADDREEMINAQAYHANASHALGEVAKARAGFVKALALEGKQLASMRGSQYARHLLDLGDLGAARRLCEAGLQLANRHGWFYNVPRFQSVLSRAALAVGRDPSIHLDKVRSWTSRTGELHFIIEAHLLTALHLLATGDPQTALGECESGLLHAVACGYGILRIELLVALARIRLAWPDAPAAIHAAREALDLATDAECGYAWGEADAAQVWGEAHFANREPELAKRAFSQALAVRRRIKHPKVAETVQWLARIG